MLPEIPEKRLLSLYHRMLLARRFEEQLMKLDSDGKMLGHYHVYIGQEAEATALTAVRGDKDLLFLNHRNHGHMCLAGANVRFLLAELLGRETGYNRGKGGGYHTSVPELGILHTTAIVGGLVPIAVGAGLGLKLKGIQAVSFAVFGDGYMNEGACQEAFNLAALKKSSTILFCENNNAGAATAQQTSPAQSARELLDLAKANSVPAEAVDGTDAGAIYQVLARARDHAVSGNGPYFVEARTKRWYGQKHQSNPALVTGETDIAMAWNMAIPGPLKKWESWFLKEDPVLRFTRELLEAGKVTKEQVINIDREAREQMKIAVDFALNSPLPNPSQALEGVFA